MQLQLSLKRHFDPRHHPPPTFKVLQTTKISKLGLLSLSPTISKVHCALLPEQVQEAHEPGLFQSRYFQSNHHKRDSQVRSPKVQSSLNHVPSSYHANYTIGNCYPANCMIADCYLAICTIGNHFLASCTIGSSCPVNCTIRNSYLANCTIGNCCPAYCRIRSCCLGNCMIRNSYLANGTIGNSYLASGTIGNCYLANCTI